eukprot:scaffold513_cov169-Amphora_coffeaeformis.AAC.12
MTEWRCRRALIAALVVILTLQWNGDDACCHAFSLFSRRAWLDQAVAAAVLGGVNIGVGVLSHPNEASAAVGNDNKLNLLPPTDDRPQINLPTESQTDQPLAQGEFCPRSRARSRYLFVISSHCHLVFDDGNPRQERPPPDAVVVLSVRKVSDPDTILRAAQIPLNSQRLPLQFQFPNKNNMYVASTEDLMVQAEVCIPENLNRTTKRCTETIMAGSGLAKALRFPSPDDPSRFVSFRAGVSIALEYSKQQQ